jgi:molybdate-binding protein
VAPDGLIAAVRLLHGERTFRLAGSDDPALRPLLTRAGREVILTLARGSFAGLHALADGEADGAAIHLRHHTGVYNAPYALALLQGRDPHLLHLWAREQGLIVPRGNPRGITTVADLAGRRVARREPGAGTRVLLDQHLMAAGLDPDRVIRGPEFHSHLEIALAVASGIAHTGLAVRSAAAQLDLDFIPIGWERFEVIFPGEALGTAEPLIKAIRDPAVRSSIENLPGYDLTDAGLLTALD